MLRYWPRLVAACQRRYGNVFTLRVASMGTLVYLADPADIKAVFAGDPAVFHAGEANSMLAGSSETPRYSSWMTTSTAIGAAS